MGKKNKDENVLNYLVEIRKILKHSSSLAREVKEIAEIFTESEQKNLNSIDVKSIEAED